MVTELEGARAAAERANAVSDQLHFERERTVRGARAHARAGPFSRFHRASRRIILRVVVRRVLRDETSSSKDRPIPRAAGPCSRGRLQDAADEAKRGELEAKRQARRMQEHMEAQTRLARNATSAFRQLKNALRSIDQQMERFAQYDMDGLADLPLNEVLDELDRQAPLLEPTSATREPIAEEDGSAGISLGPRASAPVDGSVGQSQGQAEAVPGSTPAGAGRSQGQAEAGAEEAEAPVDWVKLAAASRRNAASAAVAADPLMHRIATEY